ncbi:MAG TPA: DUF1638 domain-containing protein [Anaerohalosphaeraceae bacterium]|nr:DUF1638 domain-containing protein [Anaerohalosphaeraceae bacterium]HPC63421.1 DUF1638 domain-containing protein [Anaerohalosphaeraceae bacterium]HRS71290.1 DUF1638 domain-containing protein [Anaerohalosphaeraceae bacterium]HRV19285.1 DUF1638 domain-containing protein [Anaerohalosphaeraceae bacterium]
MRLKFVICKVMQREAYWCASRSPNIVDVVLMPQGLHNTPDVLRREVQKELDKTADATEKPYDAIGLGYCLCSNGIAGLHSDIPIVAARGHDCITLLLGSRHTYQNYFDTHKGIYWYSIGWIESTLMPGKERFETVLAEYTEKYGEENARYLMEMEQGWLKEYKRAVFIDWNLPGTAEAQRYTKACAAYLHWEYDELKGDPSLMQRLVDGDWDPNDFLVVPPGYIIREDLTEPHIITCQPRCDSCSRRPTQEERKQ